MATGSVQINLIATPQAKPISDTISTLRDAMEYHTSVVERCSREAKGPHADIMGSAFTACASMHQAYAIAIGSAIRALHPLG